MGAEQGVMQQPTFYAACTRCMRKTSSMSIVGRHRRSRDPIAATHRATSSHNTQQGSQPMTRIHQHQHSCTAAPGTFQQQRSSRSLEASHRRVRSQGKQKTTHKPTSAQTHFTSHTPSCAPADADAGMPRGCEQQAETPTLFSNKQVTGAALLLSAALMRLAATVHYNGGADKPISPRGAPPMQVLA